MVPVLASTAGLADGGGIVGVYAENWGGLADGFRWRLELAGCQIHGEARRE